MQIFKRTTFSGIEIVAKSEKDIQKIISAILCIKQDDVGKKKIRNLKQIAIQQKKSYANDLFFPERIWICQLGTVRESSVAYLASLLVHEIFHILQMKRGLKNDNFKLEPAAYKAQIKFLEKYGTKTEVQHVKKLLKQGHWNRNFIIKDKKTGRPTRPLWNFLQILKEARFTEIDT